MISVRFGPVTPRGRDDVEGPDEVRFEVGLAVPVAAVRTVPCTETEPLRISRRLSPLRGWSHDEATNPVFP